MVKPVRVAVTIALVVSAGLLAGCVGQGVPVTENPVAPSQGSAPVPTSPTPTPTHTPTPVVTPVAPVGFDKSKRSIDEASSYWVVVNKLRRLDPKDYAADDLVSVPVAYANPPMLRKRASDAVVRMFADFTDETGKYMQSQSAYRSYEAQVRVYNGWVGRLGKKAADLTSARPGFSEHQTGLAIDISAKPAECTLAACFGDTPQGKWLAKNAWKYGFVLRYPKGETRITGYEYEPWHFRYVGTELATEMHESKAKTLEQFFGLPKATDYKN